MIKQSERFAIILLGLLGLTIWGGAALAALNCCYVAKQFHGWISTKAKKLADLGC